MASKIILKKSSVAAKVPTTGDLDFGELAINYNDGKLYFKKSDGSIDAFATASAAGVTSFNGLTGAITATDALNAIKDVDGMGSGLDADFLDGLHASSFYLASNPNGYTSNTGTVTSVTAGTGLTGGSITTSGTIALATSGVTAGTYTKVTVDSYGRATSGTSLSSSDVTTALGYTPYNSTNPSGYISGITSSMVTTALGYTPYNSTNPNGYITSSSSISGNAATATILQNTRTINGINFNGSSNIKVTDWFHSDRDFASGTLVTTDINYAVTNGDPFVLEIRGNSYGDAVPYDIQYQGYIYSDTIINHGGYSNGTNISGLVALNVGGNLCFWWPRQSYWNGFNVRVYSAYATYAVNRVTSITSTAKPTSTKEVALSANIRQSLHSSNYTSYGDTRYLRENTWINSKYFGTDGAIYGTIFYDSNDSTFYVNPAGNGTRAGYLNGNLWISPKSESYGEGIAFLMPSQGTWGGIRWTRSTTNFTGSWAFGYFGNESNNDIGFHNGTNGWRLDHSFNMTSIGSVRSPIFYDSNDTGYYIDPNSTSNSAQRMRGGTLYGPNPTWGAYLYVGTDGRVGSDATVAVTNGNLHLDAKDGYDIYLNNYNGRWTRVTGLYDNNDTGYYLDMNDTSRLNYLRPNRISLVGNQDNGYPRWDFKAYVVESQHHYGHSSTQDMYFGEDNPMWFGGTPRMYIMYDRNDTGYYSDPNSTSSLNTVLGYRFGTQAGSQSPDNSHPGYGMRPFYSWNIGQAYNSTSGFSNGITIGSHPSDQAYGFQIVQNMWDDATYTRRYNSGWQTWRKLAWMNDWFGSSLIHEDGRHYATIYYDANDSGYYCDPNGTSRFNRLRVGDGSSSWIDMLDDESPNGVKYLHANSNYLGFVNGYGSWVFRCDNGGNTIAEGNVTAYSDERLKKNWIGLPNDFIENVAKVKNGTYERIDNGTRLAGSSAQDWLKLLPEVVNTTNDENKTLSLAYGNAALVTAIELAKRVIDQEARIKRLESLIEKLI